MNTHVFVPVTDEMIYNHPEQIEGPLIPYFAGMECENWLSIEINPDESNAKVKQRQSKKRRSKSNSHSPELQLAYSA